MPEGSNLLVNVPSESGITGQNIINDGVCESLVLTDGADFGTPAAFTANQASFTSEVSSYKTLVLPFEAEVPAGFTASSATSLSGMTVNIEEVSTISADSPVILQGEGALEITAANVAVSATPEEAPTSGVLSGTYKGIPAPVGSYVLQNLDDVIGFYLVGEGQPTVGAFRAYLNAPASDVKVFYIGDGDATGISNVNANLNANEKVYNLAGQRLSKPQKGINISKNKKVIYNKD